METKQQILRNDNAAIIGLDWGDQEHVYRIFDVATEETTEHKFKLLRYTPPVTIRSIFRDMASMQIYMKLTVLFRAGHVFSEQNSNFCCLTGYYYWLRKKDNSSFNNT